MHSIEDILRAANASKRFLRNWLDDPRPERLSISELKQYSQATLQRAVKKHGINEKMLEETVRERQDFVALDMENDPGICIHREVARAISALIGKRAA